LVIGFWGESAPAFAQDTQASAEEIVVVGSRRADRSAADTPVPVDRIPFGDLTQSSAQLDPGQILQYVAPSFNSNRQSGADGADLIDSAALRGLGPDQTLVLINGKRRHNVALINLFGARARGNTGTDLNSIPALAIDRVEVLRDGAAAQYGSDAIAGVINIQLKNSLGGAASASYGKTAEGDGENVFFGANYGWRLGTEGFLNVTGEWLDKGAINRNDDPTSLRRIGDAEVENRTLWFNALTQAGPADVYAFGGRQTRAALSPAFERSGVGSSDIPSRNSADQYPNGFVPVIGADVTDTAITLGARGDLGGWRGDLSHTYGSNRMEYGISNTLNASLAAANGAGGGLAVSPSVFDAGGFVFDQYSTTLDFTRLFDVWAGLNVAFGAEYRFEQYEIFAGEAGSFEDFDGAGGGNAGSQGFPGFRPGDEINADRESVGVYLDLEADVTEKLLVALAARYEDFSDFGDTWNGKIAAAFKPVDAFTVRASASTGFRAPSLQQRFFSSTITDFISGTPVDVVIAPNGGAVARAAGIPPLKEETSENVTLGATWRITPKLSATLDVYRIEIEDRIVLTGGFDQADPAIGAILQGLNVGFAQFFTNAVDTRTEGADLTLAYDDSWGAFDVSSFFAFNYNTNEVKAVRPTAALAGRQDIVLSPRERLFIEGAAPEQKATWAINVARGPISLDAKATYFGEVVLGTFSGPPVPNQVYDPLTTLDLSVTADLGERWKFTLGATNLTDEFPSNQDPNETDNGFRYEGVQSGFAGRAFFTRLTARF
jgi:iron complex outermembrane receptor protein